MKNMVPQTLPERLRPLFWSYVFESINIQKNKRLIIKQVLNYGTLTDWKWMVSTYGREEVQRVVSSLAESELKPPTKLLAEVMFNTTPRHALRRTH
ncbi:MAG: hypothetical protein WD579_03400 [Candidatus Paceibacterota bacterium]